MLASIAALVTSFALTASGPVADTWESDYGKALANTRKDDRPLLIVMDKPGVAAERIPAELLGADDKDAPLAKYDLCHVDVSTPYGKEVAKVFRADAFPYFAIIDKSGKVVLHRHSGKVTAEGWNATLAKHQEGKRAQRVTVAKPVIAESGEATTTVTTQAEPVVFGGSYYESTPSSYYATPVNSYCPNCQRR